MIVIYLVLFCACHYRDHTPFNSDDMFRRNQLPTMCTGGWIHVLFFTQ